MSVNGLAVPPERAARSERVGETVRRIGRYTVLRGASLLLTVVIGVYLSVLIANMGGHVDSMRQAVIREHVGLASITDPTLRNLAPEERRRIMDHHIRLEEQRLGLDRPFLIRSFLYLSDALTLNLGRAEHIISDSGSRQVRLILLERLVPTLLLFGTSQLLLFFGTIFVALYLSRHYGSFIDRLVVTLSPLSTAPSWLYGLFFILIFAGILKVLPFGGMVETPVPTTKTGYALSLGKHMVLPLAAIALSAIFQTLYSWRTFFMIYANEDYVEMATAKGLPARLIERRHILRPALPTIITSFSLTVITSWMGSIILETVFNWPGLGRVLVQAIGLFDTPVIVGSVVIYAYLLAATVFLLDIAYAVIDPRVRIGVGGDS